MRPTRPILVVDDEVDTRDALVELLQAEGYPVLTAGDGLEALGVLERCPNPCLVLLDLQMPRMDGVAFLKALAAQGRRREFPVVVVTASHSGAEGLDVEGYLEAPYDIAELQQVVARHCRAAPGTKS